MNKKITIKFKVDKNIDFNKYNPYFKGSWFYKE